MDVASIVQRVEQLIDPILAECGVELCDLQLLRDQGRWVLRLFIDYPQGGITLVDCARVSRSIEGVLDVEAGIPMAYHLEVSSPGLDRVLRYPTHFARYIGRIVDLRTREPIDGRAHYQGQLQEVEEHQIVMEIDGRRYAIPFGNIARARLKFFL